jgi:hypothetical protein
VNGHFCGVTTQGVNICTQSALYRYGCNTSIWVTRQNVSSGNLGNKNGTILAMLANCPKLSLFCPQCWGHYLGTFGDIWRHSEILDDMPMEMPLPDWSDCFVASWPKRDNLSDFSDCPFFCPQCWGHLGTFGDKWGQIMGTNGYK